MGKLSVTLSKTKVGCALGKTMVNYLAYADDLVILSPSAKRPTKAVEYLF